MAFARSIFSAPRTGRASGASSIGATLRAFAAELAPVPDRWRRAARVAFVTALGAGLMAAMQLANPLGLTLLVNFAAPEFAFSLATGITFLVAAAAIQLLMLATVGATVDNPVIHLCAFIAFAGVTTYLIYGVPKLGRLWLWIQIPAVTAFYLVLFDQPALGADSAQMFGGVTIAVTLLWLFNNVIWPQPAASILLASIRSTLLRSRRRLSLLMKIILGEVPPTDDREVASRLAYHLTLLHPATRNATLLREPAGLLAAVIVEERLHHEIERLAEAAHSHAGAIYDHAERASILEAADALEIAFDAFIAGIDRLNPAAQSPDATRTVQVDSLELFRECAARLPPSLEQVARRLVAIGNLLAVNEAELPDASTPMPPRPRAHSATFRLNKFLVRFCARHTVSMTLAFVAGLYDNSAALHASLWLLMIGGPPSHGATAKKFTMRAIGASGALLFAALGTIVVAPNFTTLPPYMTAIFMGVLMITYVSEGGGQLAYLGVGATAFVIAFSGPGPRLDILGSLWTIWGVSLGMIIRAVISVVSIERPNRTLAEEIERPLDALVRLASPGSRHAGIAATQELQGLPGIISSSELQVMAGVQEMLSVAADAQLQGPSAGIDARNLVDALDTMLRLAFVLGNFSLRNTEPTTNDLADASDRPGVSLPAANLSDASGRQLDDTGSAPGHDPKALERMNDPAHLARNAFDDAVRSRLDSWLANIRWQLEPGRLTLAPLRTMVSSVATGRVLDAAPLPLRRSTTHPATAEEPLDANILSQDSVSDLQPTRSSASTSELAAREHVVLLLRTLERQLTTISLV